MVSRSLGTTGCQLVVCLDPLKNQAVFLCANIGRRCGPQSYTGHKSPHARPSTAVLKSMTCEAKMGPPIPLVMQIDLGSVCGSWFL